MPVKAEEYNGVCVISVEGDLIADNCLAVRTAAEQFVLNRHLADFIVDLEKCTFTDSEGLETLLWLKNRADELFGQAKLAHLDENFKKILQITRLESRFECQDDLAAALKMMR